MSNFRSKNSVPRQRAQILIISLALWPLARIHKFSARMCVRTWISGCTQAGVEVDYRMILSDRDILKALDEGRIKIDPMPDLERQLGSVSVDFRLGPTFMMFEHSRHAYIDPRHPSSIGDAMRTIEVTQDEPFIMQPGDFALASTIETLEL